MRFVATLALVAASILGIKVAVMAFAGVVRPALPDWTPELAGAAVQAALVGIAAGVIIRRSLIAVSAVSARHAIIAGFLVGGATFGWDLVLGRAMIAFAPWIDGGVAAAIWVVSLGLAALPPAAWVLWLGLQEERSEDVAAERDFRPHVIVFAGMLALLAFFAVVGFVSAVAWLPERERLESYAHIMNVAGRQRMLSQQIARFAALSEAEPDRNLVELQGVLARMKEEADRHDALLGELAASWSRRRDGQFDLAELRSLRLALWNEADRFLSAAQLRLEGGHSGSLLLQRASDRFLVASERAVAEIESQTSAAFARATADIVNLGILLSFILVTGAMSVILPVAWIVRRQHHRLVSHARNLSASRDETKRTLRQLEAYQAALDQRVIVAITDRKGVIVYVNDRFCEISGYARGELIGQTHRIVNSGFHPKSYFAEMWRTIARGGRWQGEICNRAKDGSLYWVDTTVVPMRDENGRITQFLAIRYDITGHRRAQQALRESEAHLKRAQAVASVGSWTLDLKSGELRWSEETYRMFDVAPEVPLSYDLFLGLVHPDDREHVNRAWLRARAGEPYAVEHRIMVNGEVRHVYERADFERDASGQPVRATGTVQDVTERKRAEAKVLWQANYDTLTGLPNRRLFQERLERALRSATQGGTRGAVIMIDLDHFKTVNDTLGHTAGDEVLVEAAERLKASLRAGDMVARFGGDEFLVLLSPLACAEEAAPVTEAIQNSLSAPFKVDGREMQLAASIGVCIFPDDSDSLEEVLQFADAAMYAAKRGGRRSTQFFTSDLHLDNLERASVMEDLRSAVERGELELHYQPIVEMPTARVEKCEALLRWRHPTRGLIAPNRFVPIAQAFGLVAPISEWVVAEASRQQREWLAQGLDVQVSVNITADHVRFDDLTERLIETITRKGACRSIVLELTESLLIKDELNQFERLDRIAAAGIGIAIDDFGTGYSALSYLTRIPARYLKIDRAFTAKLHSERERRLVSAIIGIAHDLGMSVVAEGVETPEQFAFLMRKKCDYAQGYLFAKPLAAREFFTYAQSQSITERVRA